MAMMNWTSLSTTMKREHRKLEPNNYNDLKNGWAAAWGEKPPKNEPCTQNNSLGADGTNQPFTYDSYV